MLRRRWKRKTPAPNRPTKTLHLKTPAQNSCLSNCWGARRLRSAHQVLKCGVQRVLFWCVQVHNNLPTDRTTRRKRWPDFALGRVFEFGPECLSMDIAVTAHGVVASEVTLKEDIDHCSDVSYQLKMLQLRGRQPSRDNAQKGRPARVFLQIAAQHDFAITPELPSRTRSNPRRGCRFWDSCKALRRRARARGTSRLLCLCNTQDIRQLVGQVQRVGTSKVTARLMDG